LSQLFASWTRSIKKSSKAVLTEVSCLTWLRLIEIVLPNKLSQVGVGEGWLDQMEIRLELELGLSFAKVKRHIQVFKGYKLNIFYSYRPQLVLILRLNIFANNWTICAGANCHTPQHCKPLISLRLNYC
jgi:hypothetical protein